MIEFASITKWQDVHSKLAVVFPEGTPHRHHCVWEVAARTVFVMLYLNAIDGQDIWLRPDQVTRMTDLQAARTSVADRLAWAKESVTPSKGAIPGRWYAGNTRESVRDDTLRNALVTNGAVVERAGLPTTSSLGRYALEREFALLFDPKLGEKSFEDAVVVWQAKFLTPNARMRIALMRQGATIGTERILVRFPSGEARRMAPGPSSWLAQQVIEVFAPRFLKEPAVIFLSESRDKVVTQDDELAKRIGLHIAADRNLPDVILADLDTSQPLLVFVEIVASDGPISETRKAALLSIADKGGFPRDRVAFVTAFLDRSGQPFKKTINVLAWGSFAWFAAEPECLIELSGRRKSLL